MAWSEKRRGLFGSEYIQHYDDDGNETGYSEKVRGLFGTEYVQHYDSDGSKNGYSEDTTGLFGREYTQHYNEDGDDSGYSEDTTGIFGREYTQHYDDEGEEDGYSERETGLFGRKYTEHFRSSNSHFYVDEPHNSGNAADLEDTGYRAVSAADDVYDDDRSYAGISASSSGGGLGALGLILLLLIAFGIWRGESNLDSSSTSLERPNGQIGVGVPQSGISASTLGGVVGRVGGHDISWGLVFLNIDPRGALPVGSTAYLRRGAYAIPLKIRSNSPNGHEASATFEGQWQEVTNGEALYAASE